MNRIYLIFIVVLGLLLRLYFLQHNDFVIDSDEAIVGLMAKHILQGTRYPIFYYGQDYMGSMEGILTSLVFSLFGQSNVCLKVVPLLFSVLHIWLTYLIARHFVSPRFSLLAAAFCAFGPNALILWSSKTRGGFIEIVALGSLCFLLAFKILDLKKFKSSLFLLTFLLGLGWWTNNQIVFYIVPMALFCGFYVFKNSTYLEFIKLALISVFSFLIGSAPFWYANIFLEPQWATFKVLFGGTENVNVISNFKGYLSDAIPMILGAKKFWTETDFFWGATVLGYLLIVLAIFFSWRFLSTNNSRKKLSLILSFVFTVALVFCFSKFGWLSQAPRYLLPLYSVLPVLYAIAAAAIFNFLGKQSSLLYALCVFLLQLYPLFTANGMLEGTPFVFGGQRVEKDHTALYKWLENEGYSYVDTNYWIGYRLAFETNERVKFQVFGEPQTVRIKEYQEGGLEQPLVYLLVPSEAAQVKNNLSRFGFHFRETLLGGYVVLDKIEATWKLGKQIPLTKEQIHSELKPEALPLMVDGDSSTRWGSAKPQAPGMSVDIDLSSYNRQITALELDFGNFSHDAPRHLQVLGQDLDGKWQVLSDLGDLGDAFSYFPDAQGRPSKKWIIRFSARNLRTIRLLQQGKHQIFDWSIAELKVYDNGI